MGPLILFGFRTMNNFDNGLKEIFLPNLINNNSKKSSNTEEDFS